MPVRSQAQVSGWQQAGPIVGIVIGILVIVAAVALISVCVVVATYAYRHPASRVGIYMIEVSAFFPMLLYTVPFRSVVPIAICNWLSVIDLVTSLWRLQV